MAHVIKKVMGDIVGGRLQKSEKMATSFMEASFNNESRGGGVLSHVQRDNFIDALNQNTKIMNYKTQNVRKLWYTYYLRPQALAY